MAMTAWRSALIGAFLLALLPSFEYCVAQSAADSGQSQHSEALPDSTPDSSAPDTLALVPDALYYVQGDKATKIAFEPARYKSSLGGGNLVIPGPSSQLLIDELQPVFRASVNRKVARRMQLFQFKENDGKRRTKIGTVNTGGLWVNTPGISLSVKELGNMLYQIQPKKPLKPGEYGIVETMEKGKFPLWTTEHRVAAFTVR